MDIHSLIHNFAPAGCFHPACPARVLSKCRIREGVKELKRPMGSGGRAVDIDPDAAIAPKPAGLAQARRPAGLAPSRLEADRTGVGTAEAGPLNR